MARRIVCFDVETHLIANGQHAPRLVCAGTWDGVTNGIYVRDDFRAWLEPLLHDDDVLFVNQNPGFDFSVVGDTWPGLWPAIFKAYEDDRVGCTMLLCQLHDIARYGTNKGGRIHLTKAMEDWDLGDLEVQRELKDESDKTPTAFINLGARPYNLKALAQRWLDGIELEKDNWRLRYAELEGVPLSRYPEDAIKYVKLDAVTAYDVWHAILDSGASNGVPLGDIYAQTRAQLWLNLVACEGWHTDPVYVAKIRQMFEAHRERILPILLEKGLLEPKKGDAIRCKVFRFKTSPAALKVMAEQQTGTASLSKTNLGTLEASHPLHRLAHLYKAAAKGKRLPPGCTPGEAQLLRRLKVCRVEAVRRVIGRRVTNEYTAKDEPARELAAIAEAGSAIKLPRTPSGKIKMSVDSVELLDDPVLVDFALWKRSSSILAEVVRLEKGIHAPIHPSYRTLMETGRTSSGGGMAGINVQNRRCELGFREAFIPNKGHVLASLDYDWIELCLLAQTQLDWFGRSALADVINAGKDAHVTVAAMLMGLTYEDAAALKEAGDKTLKKYRKLAKALNFGLLGGLGEGKFLQFAKATYDETVKASMWSRDARDGFVAIAGEDAPKSLLFSGLTPELQEEASTAQYTTARGEVRDVVFTAPNGASMVPRWWVGEDLYVLEESFGHLRAIWFKTYPEMPLYFEKVKALRDNDSNAVTLLRSGRMRARTTFCSAANNFFQGPTSDGAKDAGFHLTKECFTPGNTLTGSRIKVFVHDEDVFQFLLDRYEAAAARAAEIMIACMKKFCPDVHVGVAPAIMRRWTKSADGPRKSPKTGRLIPEEDYRLQYMDISVEEREELTAFFERHRLELIV